MIARKVVAEILEIGSRSIIGVGVVWGRIYESESFNCRLLKASGSVLSVQTITWVVFIAALWAAIKHRRALRWHRKARLRPVLECSKSLLNRLLSHLCARVIKFFVFASDCDSCEFGDTIGEMSCHVMVIYKRKCNVMMISGAIHWLATQPTEKIIKESREKSDGKFSLN